LRQGQDRLERATWIVLQEIISGELAKARSTMRALLTLATLNANGRSFDWSRWAGADELDVKGRPRNRPFLARVFQVRVCPGTLRWEPNRKHFGSRIAEVCPQTGSWFLKIFIWSLERSELCPNVVRAKKSRT